MTDSPSDEQIKAILSWDSFHWAAQRLGDADAMDNVRFPDLIKVTEDEIYDFVLANGFDTRAVAEGGDADDHLCIAPMADGRWIVYYVERGERSEEVVVPSLADARRQVIHRLMNSARTSLNHRFRLAHPEPHLPRPSDMD